MAAAEEDSLETLLNKATSPLSRDEDSDIITKFAKKVDQEIEGAQISTRILAHKIQSPQEFEALQALVVLEFCIRNCDKSFQNEVGKFRFLNELIKVVSPKYLGDKTTRKVRDKVVQLLYVWSIGLKDQMKIRDAYQMLKQQGIVKEDPEYDDIMLIPTLPPRDEKNDIFKDNEERRKRLEKLLKSKNPEDLQAANRLIKNVVMEEQNKMEKIEKRCRMLEEVTNNIRLLNEMLSQFDADSTPESDMDTMKMLYEGCVKLRPGLFRLASDTDDDETALMDILKANDDLSRVIQSYQKLVLPRLGSQDRKGDGAEAQNVSEQPVAKSSLIDLAEIQMNQSAADADLLFATSQTTSNGDFFGASADIPSLFAPIAATSPMTSTPSLLVQPTPQVSTLPPLLPPPKSSASAKSTLSDIDTLSRDLLEKTLGRKPDEKFAPKMTARPTLNELSSKPEKVETTVPATTQPTDLLNQLLQSPTQSQPESFADFMSAPPKTPSLLDSLNTSLSDQNPVSVPSQPIPVRPLTDIFVALESIKPSTLPPITVYDNNGLRVLFHFAQEFASADRTDSLVVVVSIMSTRSWAVPNIVLQVAVPKTMKVKLQPPSSTTLAPFNPIAPTAPITQVLVLANPNKKDVKMRYKLDYKLDDQTAISETGEITGFPPFEKWGNL